MQSVFAKRKLLFDLPHQIPNNFLDLAADQLVLLKGVKQHCFCLKDIIIYGPALSSCLRITHQKGLSLEHLKGA
jgi:hypothetical protein